MIRIKDKFFLSIKFDSVEYPIQETGFGFFQLVTNINYAAPVARIQLNDPQRLFKEKFVLADQVPVEIKFGVNPGDKTERTIKFRVFDFQSIPQATHVIYTIDLIFDNIKYLSDSTTKSITDTSGMKTNSSDAIKSLATLCKFQKAMVSTTADSQVWIPGGSKYCAFAKRIAAAGYVDDKSCMILCITADGTLKYQNISNIDKKAGKILTHSSMPKTDEYTVTGVKEIIKSGLVNNLFGHSQQTIEQTAKTIHKSVSVTTNTTKLNVNSEVNSSVSPRSIFTPIDCGNTHTNYHKAIHQNIRIKSMYSAALHLAIAELTEQDILDPVQYTGEDVYNSTTVETKPLLAGGYVITGKCVYITGRGQVYEKFEVTRAGLNSDTKSQLG